MTVRYDKGMNPIMKNFLRGAAIGLVLSFAVGAVAAGRRQQSALAGKNRYLDDITPSMFPNSACACCGGTASHVHFDRESRQMVCKDRALCRLTMIYTNLIAGVESA